MRLVLMLGLLCTLPVAQAQDEGVPWGQARTIRTEHLLVTSNCAPEVSKEYVGFLEESYVALRPIILPEKNRWERTLRIYIVRNAKEFRALIRKDVVGVFFSRDTPSVPKCTLVTYHGAFGHLGTTREALLEGMLAFFLTRRLEDPDEAGIWLVKGLGNIVAESSDPEFRVVRRERLQALQDRIREGKEHGLKELVAVPKVAHRSHHLRYGWSLVHWILHADEGKHRPLFYRIWEEAKEGPVPPERIEAMLKEETGQEIDEFQEKIWKPYILELPLPPTGTVKEKVFTSDRFAFTCTLPSEHWIFDLKDLALDVQCVMTHREIPEARIEITAKVGRWTALADPEEVFTEVVDEVQDQIGGDPEILEMDGRKVARLVSKGDLWIVIPTRGVDYTIRYRGPEDELAAAIQSFRITSDR